MGGRCTFSIIYWVAICTICMMMVTTTPYGKHENDDSDYERNLMQDIEEEIEDSLTEEDFSNPDDDDDDDETGKKCNFKPFRQTKWEKHFKKVFPGRIRGPACGDRIAIVGAGPSGIHMALLLKERGFKNIEILEASSEIGGKSKTVSYRGAAHDMGTVYVTTDYEEVVKLIEKYRPNMLKSVDVPDVWLQAKAGARSLNFSSLVIFNLQMNPKYINMSVTYLQNHLVRLLTNYIDLHQSLFGEYEGDLMPEPQPDVKRKIRGSFMDLLKRNNLEDLRDIFIATFSLQGYGQLDEVPALYGLMWHTPAFMTDLLKILKGEPGSYQLLKGGFQELWQQIALREKLKVKCGAKVYSLNVLNRSCRTKIRLSFTYRRHRYYKVYDFVIWSPPVRDSLRLFSGASFQKEYRLFSKMDNSYYTTTLMNEVGMARSESPVDWFYGNIYSRKDNLVWATRDTYSLIHDTIGKSYMDGKTVTGSDGRKNVRTLVVYQFSHLKERPTNQAVYDGLLKHCKDMGFKKRRIFRQYIWQYFNRFTQKQTAAGFHWRALEIQGNNNIWFIGGSLSFESVKSVVEYNQLLVNRMKMRTKYDDGEGGEDDDNED